jgi:hypothetical protein
MTKKWTVEIQEDSETGDGILQFPPDMLEKVDWKEGDVLEWHDNKDGSYTMTKKETQWVLVEAVSTFRMRYMVEVPVGTDDYGKDKSLWALDTVTMNDAKEFSQEYLGEQIVSHRVVTKEEALVLCDKDNDYTRSWDNDHKVDVFFTTLADQE